MNYRSDIDGLRAIAVLFVLFFHAGFTFFSSGFIGVDIFFVISGYLITSIINTSINKGNFSLSEFYSRRLWRLQPSFIAALIFTMIIAVILYLPSDFKEYMTSAKYAASFMSNIYSARNAVQYGAGDTMTHLLLHTWSLSIEWQWYLFLPPGLLLVHRFVPKRFIGVITIALTLLTLIICLFLSAHYPSKSYYFLSCRLFELMTGSCLAVLNYQKLKLNKHLGSLLGLASLATLAYCTTRTNIVYGYPNYTSVIVSIAVAALIIIGSTGKGVTTKLLSNPVLVFIGTLSYSLYLWHWPIFATARYLDIRENATFIVVCFVLTGITAYLSFIYIEKPYRIKKVGLLKTVILLVLTPLIITMLLRTLVRNNEGFTDRFGKEYATVLAKSNEPNSAQRKYCYDIKTDGDNKKCIMGDNKAIKTALLIGDSHAGHFFNFFNILGKDAHLAITTLSRGACLSLPNYYQFQTSGQYDQINFSCHDESKKYYAMVKNKKYNYIIIAQRWDLYGADISTNDKGKIYSVVESREKISTALNEALDIIVKAGSTPVIMKQIAPLNSHYPGCFKQHTILRTEYIPNSCETVPIRNQNTDWFIPIFNQLQVKYPTLIFIDPQDARCNGKKCLMEFDGIPLFADDNHITAYASHKLGKLYLQIKGNPLKEIAE
ncbi:acyltransferase family protein [Rouxiella sp. WC2420]|uniref:Acyltransferase family protein n=1 Tax=Rouxiella sp. WC2420 TaxID=3234145 RepID=A0AB39VNM8_9GAMM